VLSAIDGENALELFDAHPVIDLVLLDYAMPGIDGDAVARELKVRKPTVPILWSPAMKRLYRSWPLPGWIG